MVRLPLLIDDALIKNKDLLLELIKSYKKKNQKVHFSFIFETQKIR